MGGFLASAAGGRTEFYEAGFWIPTKSVRSDRKAALPRTHFMTCWTFAGSPLREASWSAERKFRFSPEAAVVAQVN
jgi:hypothetical protein